MKTQVFLLVPYDVPADEIGAYQERVLAPHRFDPNVPDSRGRFDYLVGPLSDSFHDPIAEGRLPSALRATYAGRICDCVSLPVDAVPGALVTPDGAWHDLADFGWKMTALGSRTNDEALAGWERHFRNLIEQNPHCLVVELGAHS